MLGKKELRQTIRTRRAALPREYREAADCAIRAGVLSLPAWKEAGAVFVYVSIPGEPDTHGILDAALLSGKRVYVPHCCSKQIMKAVRIRSTNELKPGVLGIPAPVSDAEAAAPGELDLAIVPCLAASSDGRRIGHGMGYYDGFLKLHGVPTCCLCYEKLLREDIPMDGADIWMDCVVTEKTIYSR